MKIDIESIAEEKGKIIAKTITEKYDEYSYSNETKKVEKEIYERCLHEATAFFLNNSDVKFDEKIIETLKFRLETKLQNPKVIKKMTTEDMLAHLVKIYVLDFLLEWDGIVI